MILRNVMCLLNTLKTSSQVLKMIECIKWIVCTFALIISSVCICKILRNH